MKNTHATTACTHTHTWHLPHVAHIHAYKIKESKGKTASLILSWNLLKTKYNLCYRRVWTNMLLFSFFFLLYRKCLRIFLKKGSVETSDNKCNWTQFPRRKQEDEMSVGDCMGLCVLWEKWVTAEGSVWEAQRKETEAVVSFIHFFCWCIFVNIVIIFLQMQFHISFTTHIWSHSVEYC